MDMADRGGVVGWVSEHPLVDVGAAAIVAGAHLTVVARTGRADWLGWIGADQRIAVFGTGAVVVSVLGGLAAVGVASYQASAGPRAIAVRARFGRELRGNWRSLLISTGLAALLCMLAQAVDGPHPLLATGMFEFAILLWLLQFARLVWLMDRTFAIADRDVTDPGRVPAPAVDPRWKDRAS
jgi:hypothetical protein